MRRAAGSRAGRRPASTANLPTSPSCVVAADSLFASQSRETPGFESIASSDPASSNPPMPRRRTGTTEAKRRRLAISCAGPRARAPAEGRRLGGEGSGGRKPLGILIGLCPPLPSPPRPRYRAARALTRPASTANLPTSPACVVAADSLFASRTRETPGTQPGAALAHTPGMLADPGSKSAHAAHYRRRHSRPSRVRTRPPRIHPCRAGERGQRRRNGGRPAISWAGRRARAPAEGRRLGGEGSGGRKPLGILIGLCPPLPSPPRPRYRAARALTRPARPANLPTSPACVVAADSLFASRSRETPGSQPGAALAHTQACLPIPGE